MWYIELQMPRDNVIQLRVDDDEFHAIEAAAKRVERTISDWSRRALITMAEETAPRASGRKVPKPAVGVHPEPAAIAGMRSGVSDQPYGGLERAEDDDIFEQEPAAGKGPAKLGAPVVAAENVPAVNGRKTAAELAAKPGIKTGANIEEVEPRMDRDSGFTVAGSAPGEAHIASRDWAKLYREAEEMEPAEAEYFNRDYYPG
jgi:hypothetical protein